MEPEPWFSVRDGDVFPSEFRTFLGLPDGLRGVFEEHHADLFDVEFWLSMQERNRRGEVIDFFPYAESERKKARGPSVLGDRE